MYFNGIYKQKTIQMNFTTNSLFKITIFSILFSPIINNIAISQNYAETEMLIATDASANDKFGNAVSISGDFAIVGAHDDDDAGASSGAAYIFKVSNGNWSQSQKITANDANAGDLFGYSVSINENQLIIGAYGENNYTGAAYIFEYNGSSWLQTAKLIPIDGDDADFYGYSVSISGDRAIIGSRYDDDNGNSSGSAYIYEKIDGNWLSSQKISASDGAANDDYGVSVSISNDRIIVGSYADDDFGSTSGSAYLYNYVGDTWVESQKINASDATAGDFFGFSTSISGDKAIIGASNNAANGTSSGAAYVFNYNGSSWTETQKIVASDVTAGDKFGYSVSISGDNLIIGSYGNSDSGFESGSAYVFSFNGSLWSESDKLTAADAASNDRFGYCVAMETGKAIIGAYGNSDSGTNSGSAYIFEDPTLGVQESSLINFDPLIYPNPSTGEIVIQSTNTNKYTIEIFNVAGDIVFNDVVIQSLSSEIVVLKNPGIYILRLTSEGKSKMEKIIIH